MRQLIPPPIHLRFFFFGVAHVIVFYLTSLAFKEPPSTPPSLSSQILSPHTFSTTRSTHTHISLSLSLSLVPVSAHPSMLPLSFSLSSFHISTLSLSLRMLRSDLFIVFLSLTTTLSLSRELPQTTTAILDVAGSISATREVLSGWHQSTDPTLSSSLFSAAGPAFGLRPRDAVGASRHRDYRSLTLHRLARDADRVESLNARLALKLKLRKPDLKLTVRSDGDQYVSVDDLHGRVVSGLNQGSGEYFARVGFGSPAQPRYVAMDTGSDVTWIQCQPCSNCYRQADPVFNPAVSASYTPLQCNSSQCRSLDVSSCRDGTCQYQVSYGDGSFTVGNLALDSLTFGPGATVNRIALGCGHDNEGLFVGAAGLLGLGGGSLSFPRQVAASTFSYCLVDRDSNSVGTLVFGPGATNVSGLVRAPLIRNVKMPTFYYVGLAGISVGGSRLPISPSVFKMNGNGTGGVILDSGTSVTRLPISVYNAVRDAFTASNPSLLRANSFSHLDTCYNLSSRSRVSVATITFHFDSGESLQLPAKNYLVPVDSAGTFCLAFASALSGLSIIGNVQQQGVQVFFDSVHSQVGFAPNRC